MEFRVNYVVVGLFVLIITALTLATGLWLSAGFQNKTYDIYEILMYEPVSGLNEQAPVKFNGVQVGYIKSIDLNDLNPRQVILLAALETGTPITKSTVATLMSQGITGVTYIGLKARTPHADPLKKLPGEEYPIIPSAPSFLVELDSTLRDLSSHLVDVTNSIERILSPENAKKLSNILTHTDNILKNIDDHSQDISEILKNTNKVITHISKGSEDFPNAMKQFNRTLVSLEQASDDLSGFIDQGGYTLRQWSNQFVPTTFSLLYQVSRLTANLDTVASELKTQPSLLIYGKAAAPLGPGE